MKTTFAMLALIALVLAACSGKPSASITATPAAVSSAPSSTPSATLGGAAYPAERTAEAGAVTISATWTGPQIGPVFEVELNTHSVALDALTLSDAVLRNDRGETLAATPWSAPAGGHHRSGDLTFSGDSSGFFGGAKSIELILYNIADIPETVLHWDV